MVLYVDGPRLQSSKGVLDEDGLIVDTGDGTPVCNVHNIFRVTCFNFVSSLGSR